jgi:hypothetical protein
VLKALSPNQWMPPSALPDRLGQIDGLTEPYRRLGSGVVLTSGQLSAMP